MQASIMRMLSPSTLCLLLNEKVVIQAELETPLSPRSQGNMQTTSILKPVPARIQLGKYDLQRHKFTGCRLEAEIPEVKYERLAYASRRK